VLIVGLAVVAAVASIVLADVIFIYTGTINAYNIRSPLIFDSGPNAYPASSAAAPYVSFSQTGTGFTVNLAITNALAIYYYEVGQLTVTANGFLYVNGAPTITGNAGIGALYIYITPTSNPSSPVCIITLSYSSGSLTPSYLGSSSTNDGCSLPAGTYYINIKVVPITTLPASSVLSINDASLYESITVNFGYNVVSTTQVTVPS
jgi:hypothetical protein